MPLRYRKGGFDVMHSSMCRAQVSDSYKNGRVLSVGVFLVTAPFGSFEKQGPSQTPKLIQSLLWGHQRPIRQTRRNGGSGREKVEELQQVL